MSLPVVVLPGRRGLVPRIDAFTRRFWDSLEQGEFLGSRCMQCGRRSFPARRVCPGCGSIDTEWIPLATQGKLYSATVIHAGPGAYWAGGAYTVGIVDLDDGVRLLTRILGPIPPPIDSAVQLVLTRHDDGCLFAAIACPANAT